MLVTIVLTLRLFWDYLCSLRELGSLTDRELRELGLSPSHFSAVAWDEALRRSARRQRAIADRDHARLAAIDRKQSRTAVDDSPAIHSPAGTITTQRAQVWLLLGTGVVAAAQVGKAVISLPMIRTDLSLGLDVAGLIVATFATLGALTGLGAGIVVGKLGTRRALIGGMAAIALGNAIGALAPNEFVLLAARIVEGVGFFGTVLAIPSTLSRIVDPKDRDFVMAFWSGYMPAGIMLMLFLGPLLPLIGWRNLWLANALAATACTALLAVYAPAATEVVRGSSRRFFDAAIDVLRRPQCLSVAFAFFAYSCQIFSLAFALPLLLTSAHGLALGAAGLLSGLVMAVSTMGHVTSGFLLRAGVPIWLNVAITFGFFFLASFAIYSGSLPPQAVAVVAALALGVGGLAPGALYAAAPRTAPNQQDVPLTIGLVQQASNLGQFAGPVVLGLWVEHLGWHTASAIVAPAALVGLAFAFALRVLLAPQTDAAGPTSRPAQVRLVANREPGGIRATRR